MPYKKIIPSDIFIIIAYTILTVIFIVVPPLSNTWIRTVLGLPMVLFFPGYALIAALFPKKDDLDAIERIALSFGLSIAVVPLLGLGLNYTPWGIRLIPILATLMIFTLIMCAITIYRRSELPVEEVFSVPFAAFFASIHEEIFTKPESRVDRILTVILVISIIASVVMLVYVIVTPKQGEKFTEFYILGPGGMADDYPVEFILGDSATVIVGVVNHEYAQINYSLALVLENESLTRNQEIMLAHNETWEQHVTFTPDRAGTDMKLQFLLYWENNFTVPYRDLHLWIDVSELQYGI
ncbi:MAG: DUF1616 domain-containing protein [ANME-2 cluster archaeon]|nr:DUF1616 domain-containing protein [ANME-2 cluster archaeon]MBC2700591.1 DUF1616 domain-containing protein [ANME-2 cluster archaeon]MBC2708726.1 DUF1616 domain-containing protein [ANME-2 cluster archaeon]MBC2747968.1 DUF1616 domain-containing protein [ANME-2 cluster archaeon]MBC2764267.1 DUF1616 domain-containing protein [ANME-2 cluster archaeon]